MVSFARGGLCLMLLLDRGTDTSRRGYVMGSEAKNQLQDNGNARNEFLFCVQGSIWVTSLTERCSTRSWVVHKCLHLSRISFKSLGDDGAKMRHIPSFSTKALSKRLRTKCIGTSLLEHPTLTRWHIHEYKYLLKILNLARTFQNWVRQNFLQSHMSPWNRKTM